MKKLNQRFFAILLAALTLVSVLPTSAFAAGNESGAIPEGAVKHEIEFTIDPDDPVDPVDPVDPIWDSGNYYVKAYSVRNTLPFYIPERYLAYEVSATDSDGNSVNGYFSVAVTLGGTIINSHSFPIDGVTRKVDYIDLGAGTYQLRMTNHTSTPIIVKLTYYSFS